MIQFDLIEGWKCFCIQRIADFPNFIGAKKIYLDVETTSLDTSKASTNPHKDCELLGISITVDDHPHAYYIPMQHEFDQGEFHNVNNTAVLKWLQDILDEADEWINHNIKYDAHVLRRAGIRIPKRLKLCDTNVRIKIVHSDRFNYELSRVAGEFLFIDITPYEDKLKRSLGRGVKDYGCVPIDVMTPYAAVDALIVRELNNYCENQLHPDCVRVWDLETKFTPILWDIECKGTFIDIHKVIRDMNSYPQVLAQSKDQLCELIGNPKFRPHVSGDVEQLLCGYYGLPVIQWTEKGKPSFGKGAFEAYKGMPGAPIEILDILLKYREYYKLYTSFTIPYANFVTEECRMFPDYNQIVRTGRMSCRNPNMQQLSKLAKEYIIAPKGKVLVDIDFSQIEFRLIVHYIEAMNCIAAYRQDPDTDYHKWVADECNIPRDPAKNINFAIGYGAGKTKVLKMLSALPEIVGELATEDERIARAEHIYNTYYATFPGLRHTRWQASQNALARGFVRTLLGRHRDIPSKLHFIAFNTVIQGSAADLMKTAALRLYDYVQQYSDMDIIGIVHDSFVLEMDIKYLHLVEEMKHVINQLPKGIKLRVPIRSDVKTSTTNWRAAA